MVSGKFFQYCLVVPPGIPSERLCRFPLPARGFAFVFIRVGRCSAERGGWASGDDGKGGRLRAVDNG